MEFRTLRAFVEVVRQGGFSSAAKTLFATQSTVSKAVRQLEDELGVPLLDRIGRRTSVTAVGEVVYARSLRLLAERADLVAELNDLRGLRRGTLRLGLPPVGSAAIFAPLFAVYRERYPGVEILLVEHGATRLEELLLAGDIDLAATLLPAADDFHVQPILREPLVALIKTDQRLSEQASIDLAVLRDQPFILFESGFALNRIILDACSHHGFAPKVVARSAQIDFVIELVAAGLGIAFLPRMIAQQRPHAKVCLVALDEPETDWHLAMAWRRAGHLSDPARAWLDLMREFAPAR